MQINRLDWSTRVWAWPTVLTMQLSSIPVVLSILFSTLVGTAYAASPAPLRTELTLTHVAPDKWRADYVFAEPVTLVDLGEQVGPYRQQAWRPMTPGVELVASGDHDSLRSASPLTRLSVEISAYGQVDPAKYAPINHFSDGGSDFYLGFLYGSLTQDGRARTMDVTFRLAGLAGETVLAPSQPGAELNGYAYFGPQQPARLGNVNVIVDPQAPAWLRQTIDETTAKVSQYYEQAFQRKLTHTPLVSISMAGFDGPPRSMDMKGGVIGGGVGYRLQGPGLVDDHPKKRAHVARLVAHEMAHLWQLNLTRGGVGEKDAWIHEGGAEALMLEALRSTGLFTGEASDQYAKALLDECEQLKNDTESFRGRYACGFKRFHGFAIAPVPLWRALVARSESSGEFYSEPMIQAILKQ